MIGYGIHEGKLVTGYLNVPLSFLSGRGLSTSSVLLSNGYSNRLENTININVGAKYKFDDIIKGLSARTMFAYDHFYGRSEVRNRALDTYYAVKDGDNNLVLIPRDFEGGFDTFSEGHSVYRIEYFEAALEYLNNFGNHKVSGLLLYNQRKRTIPGLDYSVPESLQGIVGRATYAYADRYFTEFNLGYNGSENFPEEFRFGLFPALSVGWVLSEEPFFPKINILDWVKFRASYGVVGNDKIGGSRFLYLPTSYAYGGVAYQFGNDGVDRDNYKAAMEGQIGNPYVTWEKAIKQNVGVDLRLFNSQLIFTADYFLENRNNILINRSTVPAIVGVTELPAVNMGRVENSGVEFETHWKQKRRNFTYNIDANISYAKNKILFQDEPAKAYEWMMSTGYSVGQLKGYRTDGLYNYQDEVQNRPYYSFYSNMVQKGDIKYVDIDGDGKVDQDDVVPIGYNEYPQITFGCNFGASWKGFDASVLFQGATQTSIQQRVMTAWAFNLGANNTLSEHLNRWNEERFSSNELITMPRLSSDGKNSPNAETSDFWLEDATYLRLKNVEIGYSITSKTLTQLGLSTLRLYMNGNNILTFTNLKNADPENPTKNVGAVYPQMKVFNIGANIRF
jgi:TonB-linked SusC/RagA family outer membrane protein